MTLDCKKDEQQYIFIAKNILSDGFFPELDFGAQSWQGYKRRLSKLTTLSSA